MSIKTARLLHLGGSRHWKKSFDIYIVAPTAWSEAYIVPVRYSQNMTFIAATGMRWSSLAADIIVSYFNFNTPPPPPPQYRQWLQSHHVEVAPLEKFCNQYIQCRANNVKWSLYCPTSNPAGLRNPPGPRSNIKTVFPVWDSNHKDGWVSVIFITEFLYWWDGVSILKRPQVFLPLGTFPQVT